LKAVVLQLQEHLDQHREMLSDVEHVNERKAEELAQAQQEILAKTSQVKQYKKQVDALKNEVCTLSMNFYHLTFSKPSLLTFYSLLNISDIMKN